MVFALVIPIFLRKNGWRGLCVEADPQNHFRLMLNRRSAARCAAGMTEGTADFFQCFGIPDLSGLAATEHNRGGTKIKVPVFRLETLMKKHGIECVDLLSIDTEG